MHALELRAEGKRAKEAAQAAGVSAAHISRLASKYFSGGIDAIAGNHYGGNRRNLSAEEEECILQPFYEKAEKGEIVEISEIKKAYQEKVDHKVSETQIYYVLRRHGWRKIMPRSRHPKKASPEASIASSSAFLGCLLLGIILRQPCLLRT